MNDALIQPFIMYCCIPKALYNHVGGGGLSSNTTSVQHLDDATACHRTTVPVRSPHTSYRWRGERVIESIKWMGIIRKAMIDKGQWWEFGQDTGVTPLLFMRSAMGFLLTTESQDLGLTSHPKDGIININRIIYLYYNIIEYKL